jgi:uncharacterized protein (TIGR00297 family)
MPILVQLAIGLILSALIGYAGYRRGSLSRSGVVGAMIVGTAIFGFGGLAWGLVLITFFVTSSLLSHYKESVKATLAEKFDKGHQRDLGQALANGGAGALIAAVYAIRPDPMLMAAFVGAMATVNADTWATELGVLNPEPPRLITTWAKVEVGTSGGISLRGTLASLGGALVIGVAAYLFQIIAARILPWPLPNDIVGDEPGIDLFLFVALGGLAGSLFDSLLGATVQAIYYCPTCKKETERRLHTCGTPTEQRRGWRWLNNDWVNFISSLFGAAIAAGLFALAAR